MHMVHINRLKMIVSPSLLYLVESKQNLSNYNQPDISMRLKSSLLNLRENAMIGSL